MAVFFSGVFNPNVFSTEGGAVEEVVKTGTGGIDPAKRNRIYKPTGLPLKPPKEGRKSTQDRVDESGQIQAPRTVSIGGVQKDSSGNITGASIKTTPNLGSVR